LATRMTDRPSAPGFGTCGRHEACRSGRPRQALDGLPVMRVAWVPALLKCKGPTGLLQQQAEHGAGQYLHHWTRDKGRVSATLDLSGNPTPDPIQRGRLASKRTSHFPPANFPSFTTHTAPLCKRPSIFTHSYGHDAQHARLCCAGSHAAGPRYVPPGCSHAPWQPVCAAAVFVGRGCRVQKGAEIATWLGLLRKVLDSLVLERITIVVSCLCTAVWLVQVAD